MAAQHFRHEKECSLGVPALCEAEQVSWRENGVFDFDLEEPSLELGAYGRWYYDFFHECFLVWHEAAPNA